MRTIIKSLIVAAALVTSGSVFANDSGDTTLSTAITQSQLAFAAQSNSRSVVVERPIAAPRVTSQAAINQGFAPINTQDLSRGSNN